MSLLLLLLLLLCFISRVLNNVEQTPADPMSPWVRETPPQYVTKICCEFFRIGLYFSGKTRCSTPLLRDLGVTELINIMGGGDYRVSGGGGGRGTGYLRH
jgi:hypothetical protein